MKNKELLLDGIDKIILKHLIHDARLPILTIAKEVGISGAAIHQRLRKLEQSGLLKGSKFVLDTKVLGYKTLAFIGIYLEKAGIYQEVLQNLQNIPEVIESHYTTGNYSIFIKILCRDNEHLMQVLNKKIQGIKGIARTETFISLDQQIDRQIEL